VLERNLDLIAALLAVALITAIYLPLMAFLPTAPGSLIGHGIGIAGFLLMLATETLYSLRKRSWRAGWGPLNLWLSAHIFSGIVGPYMVFLHTGFQFAGIAGVTTLLMIVVVASGFVGRYVYTAVPHTPAGVTMEAAQLAAAIEQSEAQVKAWLAAHPAQLQALVERMGALPAAPGCSPAGLLARWEHRRRWQREVARLDQESRRYAGELARLLARRRTLQRQAANYAQMRRLLGLWHAFHVPLGMALFAAAFLHVVGVLYYR
jgi:hypothetical protein